MSLPVFLRNKYKSGTLVHGILHYLHSQNGARYRDIMANFPTLLTNSTLTYVRREGLIEKAGPEFTARWQVTQEGINLLANRDMYTPADFWRYAFKNFPFYGAKMTKRMVDLTSHKFRWELTEEEIKEITG